MDQHVRHMQNRNLSKLLATWKPLEEEFPEIKDLPADDVDF